MIQTQFIQASWPQFNNMNSTFGQYEYSPSIATTENSPTNSSDSCFQSFFRDDFVEFSFLDDEMQDMLPVHNIGENVKVVEEISGDEIADVYRWLNESEGEGNISSNFSMDVQEICSPNFSMNSCDASSQSLTSMSRSLILPVDDMELDNHSSLCHMLKGYAEAMEEGHSPLCEVIVGCIEEKVSPVGEALERVLFNLFQSTETQGNFIKQESSKNFEAAFRAFYGSFPYGRIPHFAANSAILEAIPSDAKTVHILDFDMGAGVQWPPIIEALANQQKALILTSIMEENSAFSPPRWRIEETKWRLHQYARSLGVTLKVEETRLVNLANYVHESKRRSNGSEWLVFNCMTNLPHMGRPRSRSDVIEFLKVAQATVAISTTKKGLLTYGHGEHGERIKYGSSYSTFLEENLSNFQALYESLECNFPAYYAEARLTMESLFLAPYVSTLSSYERWEEMNNSPVFEAGLGLRGRSVSKESLMEAREMVKEGETSYKISTQGKNDHEIMLQWRGIPLVRVSTWM